MQQSNDSAGSFTEGNNASRRVEDCVKDEHVSSNAEAQLLCAALRSIIISLVQTVVPYSKDLHQVTPGPEDEDFFAALRKYISCIIQDRFQSDGQEGITRTVDVGEVPESPVNMAKEEVTMPHGIHLYTPSSADAIGGIIKTRGIAQPNTTAGIAVATLSLDTNTSFAGHDEVSAGTKPFEPTKLVNEESTAVGSLTHEDHPELQNETPLRPISEVLDSELAALREHVFNEMPIRLLCFERRGSKLDITLQDRPGIYSHLASKLRDEVNRIRATSPWMEDKSQLVPAITKYAILSHTWLRSAPGEVTYNDWHHGDFDITHSGYQKLVNFCKVATDDHGLTLGWMDTICINKSSSTELDESIRSMYKWYQKAEICITYLAETTALSDMAKDAWFTRGWTLQELLAPQSIKFYGSEWTKLADVFANDKADFDIQKQIEEATTITPNELIAIFSAPVSRIMQWAANRKVTRGEDAAYSLMGMFNVNMSIAYGEGAELAFIRLLKEILSITKYRVLDIFNWGGEYGASISSLLPSSPQAYLRRSDTKSNPWRTSLMEPLLLTHVGIRIHVLLLPAAPTTLSSPAYTPFGDYSATINIRPVHSESTTTLSSSYNILDKAAFGTLSVSMGRLNRLAFGVLNCEGDESKIFIPSNCFAIALQYDADTSKITSPLYKRKVLTEDPIIFKLNDRKKTQKSPAESHTIERSRLARQGMQFFAMYL